MANPAVLLRDAQNQQGDLHVIQDKGIATGTGPATASANLFLGIFEQDYLSPKLLAFLPFIKRYIDDGFAVLMETQPRPRP